MVDFIGFTAIIWIKASHGKLVQLTDGGAPRSTAALPLVNRGSRRLLGRVGKDLTPFLEVRLVDLAPREALLQNFKSRLLRCFRLRFATATARTPVLL
jgi:hypothetical protein